MLVVGIAGARGRERFSAALPGLLGHRGRVIMTFGDLTALEFMRHAPGTSVHPPSGARFSEHGMPKHNLIVT
ncbi:hypothetical protein [Azospirillum brasilense]|uniref:hypothetical protein n=1 Tax=Azospirillum brasilense TaxID=192 RepID=UPI0013B454FA|nr:hypothetical protein [Azospirillum brasilense]